MIWLQSNEQYHVLGMFDPSTGSWVEYSRDVINDSASPKTVGFFSNLGDVRIGIYGVAGVLFLVIDSDVIKLAEDETIEVDGRRDSRVLRVVNKAGYVVNETRYSLARIPGRFSSDPTAFVDSEDFDIGLFASNVSKIAERRAIFTGMA
jgi:hypothetical protein